MIKKILAQAVAMAMTGGALSVAGISGASASSTMHNTWNAGQAPGQVGGVNSVATDGWTYTNGTTNSGTRNSWMGILTPNTPPFGYTGKAALTWAAEITGTGDTATISATDSLKYHYQGSGSIDLAADVDTAKGAWEDASGTPTGWRHAIDFGVIKADANTTITLTPHDVTPTTPSGGTFADNFGISVYEGMDTSTNWGHHGSWHTGYVAGDTTAANLARVNGNNPIGTSGLTFLTFMDSSGLGPYGDHSVTFNAVEGHYYTIILGGRDGGGNSWMTPQAGYSLSIQAVPIPAAVWLFGSALAGMGIIGRRKNNP